MCVGWQEQSSASHALGRLVLVPLVSVVTAWLLALGQLAAAVPAPLVAADQAHTSIFKNYGAAIVGLRCRAGRMGYYGTGVVISGNGHVLTNTTVIPKGGADIKVFFTDGRVRDAEILHLDEPSEGVVLKLTEAVKDLVHMKLADSSHAQVGDPVYSWGNPLNTIQIDGGVSLSIGSISGRYHVASVDDQSRYRGPVIETDAAVNPGSDGGPITDHQGRVLGVMSLAFSATRWLGLVIPSERLVKGIPELKQWQASESQRPDAKVWAKERAFQKVAELAGKSTVGVWVHRDKDIEAPVERRGLDEVKDRKAFPRRGRAEQERGRPPVGLCSGLIVDRSGIVITAAFNVAEDGGGNKKEAKKNRRAVKQIRVYMPDGQGYNAKVLGRSAGDDLAVLQLQDTKGRLFPAVSIVDPKNALRPGQAVAALGRSEAPGSLTMNMGIVSAVSRGHGHMFQHSALLNYGNLGGPLINLDGQVVGLTNRLNPKTRWRQNCGVAFALNTQRLLAIIPDLKAGKKVVAPKRAVIGVQPDMYADGKGMRIKEVVDGGAAKEAGMQAGDVIIAVDDQEIDDPISFLNILREHKPGDSLLLTIKRGGTSMKLAVILKEAE